MSVNPPPGSGRNNEWSGDNQQGDWPNPSGQPSGNGWNQQPESGWDQQPDTGWGQPNPQPNQPNQPNPQSSPDSNNGWGDGPGMSPPQPPAPPDRQYPRPKHPQSESAQALGAQGGYVQQQSAQPHSGQYPRSQDQYPQDQYPQSQGAYAAAPATKPRSRKGLIAMGVVLIVAVALGIGWGAATLFGSNSGDDTVAAPASSEAKEPSDTASSGQDSSESPEPSESQTLPDDPAKALDQLVETDRPSVKADLNGKWVPQLSSKKLGLEAEGKTWKEKDILAEHQELREEYPRVQMVWSGDFSSFKENDFWVTVVGIGYDDPEEALSWCSAHGLGADYCYAKQLNTSGGTEGTTRLQD